MTADIFDIKRFAVHDGPGIRTTVFFKRCPLECVWCHNPEGLNAKRQLGFYKHKCMLCGKCTDVCCKNAHIFTSTEHYLDRESCTVCGKCADACPNEALTVYGYKADVDRVLNKCLEDADFYYSSNGGVTLSGGECLLQADFCAELVKKLKKENIHVCIDTCGFVPEASVKKVMEYTDLFLYDIKAYDEDVHVKCTGKSNKLILENLKYIDRNNKKIEIRIPYIPGLNSHQIEKISKFLAPLKNITKVKVLPYHDYALSKYLSLDMKQCTVKGVPDTKELEQAKRIVSMYNLPVSD